MHRYKVRSLMNELNVSRTYVSFNEFYQPAYSQCINTLSMWTALCTTHSVCVVSMLDSAMFDCATLVSAPVKEGPRDVSFVHSQPPARRGSIETFGLPTSCWPIRTKRNSLQAAQLSQVTGWRTTRLPVFRCRSVYPSAR